MLIFIVQVFADTIPDGSNVYGTWHVTNSPYVIMGEVEIPADCTLIIEAGVRVKMLSSTADSAFNLNTIGVGVMLVFGEIIAEGTITDSIYFERTGEGSWGSLSILNNDSVTCIFRYCNVSFGRTIQAPPGGTGYVAGLRFSGTNGIIENSLFENNPSGIGWGNCEMVFRNCIVRNNSTGIHSGNSNSLIENNWVYNNQETGISSHNSNSMISNNIVEGSYHGVICYETNDTVRDNIIRNNSWGGMGLTRSTVVVIGNIIYGSNSGIRCDNEPHLINNTIVNNNYFGIYLDNYASPIIVNSIFYGNQNLITTHDSDSIVFANCLVQVDTLPEGTIDGGGNIYNHDPCFASISSHEFSLAMNSPCVDMGTQLFVWENDTILNFSPDEYYGNAPDMGAVESLFTGIKNNSHENISDLLSQNSPNPFSNSTIINIIQENNYTSSLEILNLSGKLVYSVEIFGKGEHSVIWDGRDSNGIKVETGIYISVLKNGDNLTWKPMIFTD